MHSRTRLPALSLFTLLAACGGGGGAAPTPAQVSATAGWRITIYYTPVMSFYTGAAQTVTGCSDLQCTNRNINLGAFPSDFVAAVQTEGTGKIASNQYLNWSVNVGYWKDTLPRNDRGAPLMPYRSAAADPSVPFGTTFKIASCGADTTTGTPTAPNVCSSLQSPSWIVTDRFTAGAAGQHVDLYVGDQPSANFTSSAGFIDASGASITLTPPVQQSAIWHPGTTDTLQWILGATLDTTEPASVYDIDAFNSSPANVAALHSLGRHAVCYINTGVYENFRSDSNAFPAQVIGTADVGWPGESWLDIRRIDVLGPIMQARMDMCKAKGFDAIEPDNIDGFQNPTGFPLGADDQVVYNSWLASLAHERHLAIALKNDDAQVAQLQPVFDFALTEDCWQQGWCGNLAPFHASGKAVFNVEYTDMATAATFTGTYCPQARAAGFDAILKQRPLDAWIQTCP